MKIRAASKGLVEAAFEKRAARAESLAASTATAQEPLRFAAGLYRVQGRIAGSIEASHSSSVLSGRFAEDSPRLIEHIRDLFRFIRHSGPAELAAEAAARAEEERSVALNRLGVCWSGDRKTSEDYLSRAALRPYVEVLAHFRINADRLHRSWYCPFCGGAPWIAARRSETSMDGAQRLLGCVLCGGEWPVNRIRCPSCGEEDPRKLPSFQTDAYPSVRIEACETCHRYVKSIDQTLDARSIPEVDDLLSLAMDVWATEAGFTRIEPGLAGI